MKLNYKNYTLITILLTVTVSLGFVGINFVMDDYGLWRSHESRRIWGDPLTSKFLLSQRYVPEHYRNILVGPSVSANIDPQEIKSVDLYNMSVAGANIERLLPNLKTFLNANEDKGMVIVSLYPYIVNDLQLSKSRIYETPYRSSLFSTIPIHALLHKMKERFISDEHPYDRSEEGYIDISEIGKNRRPSYQDYVLKIEKKKESFKNDPTPIIKEKIVVPSAYETLDRFLNEARKKEYKIVAYFYPLNIHDFEWRVLTGEWPYFKSEMLKLFREDEVVWDFNTEEYDFIRRSNDAYMDNHFNRLGASLLAKELDKKLREEKVLDIKTRI